MTNHILQTCSLNILRVTSSQIIECSSCTLKSSMTINNTDTNWSHSSHHLLSLVLPMKIQVKFFWVVMPCSDVIGYQHFRGPCCLHLHPGYTKNMIFCLLLNISIKLKTPPNMLTDHGSKKDKYGDRIFFFFYLF
jgi:hypothetical protein